MIFYYLLIAIMPLEEHPVWGYNFAPGLTVVKLVGVLCFFIAVFRILVKETRPPFFQTSTFWWYAAFTLLECSSYFIQGGHLAEPLGGFSNVISVFLLFISTLTLVNSRERLRRSLLVVIGAVAFTSLYALRQWQEYRGMYASFRPPGMFEDANEYALVAGLWMPLAWLWAFGKRPRWERAFCLSCFGLILLGTTFAASRGAMFGLVASFLVLVWHSRHRVRNLVLGTAVLLPLTFLGSHSAMARFLHPSYGDKLGKEARLAAWHAGMHMIAEHPVIGVGLRNFRYVMAADGLGNSKVGLNSGKVVSVAHNTYIEAAAELGVPGLIIFLGILVASFRMLAHVRSKTHRGRLRGLYPIAVGLQAGLVGYVINAFFLSTSWYKMVWLLLFLSLSLHHIVEVRLAPETAEGVAPPMQDAARG